MCVHKGRPVASKRDMISLIRKSLVFKARAMRCTASGRLSAADV